MSLDPPAYILSLQNNLRARPISWEGAVRAKTITDLDLKQIRSIDKVRKEQRKQTIESDPDAFRGLFLGGTANPGLFRSASKRPDIIQYLLVLLGDLIEDIPSFATNLNNHPSPYKPLIAFISKPSNPEDPTPLLTSTVLSNLISHALSTSSKYTSQMQEALPALYQYMSALAQSPDSGLQDIAAQNNTALLRTAESRKAFWKRREETVTPLINILKAAAGNVKDNDTSTLMSGGSSIRTTTADHNVGGGVGIQLLYHVLLVFWQLSFEGELVGPGLDQDYDIIPLYAQLIRVSPKEKVTRLLISTLYNLLSTNQAALLPGAALVRLPALLGNLKGRHLTDPDLLEDLENLQSLLEDYSMSQTTFDEYAAEVRSGHLRWSPPHRSATFWKENARRIVEEERGELPKKLAEIMAKGWERDRQVLAIGCNDVAFLVKEVPEKKQQLEKYGLKARVMELMQSPDENVRWESLKAVGEWLRYSFDG